MVLKTHRVLATLGLVVTLVLLVIYLFLIRDRWLFALATGGTVVAYILFLKLLGKILDLRRRRK